jgi:hypothetical protein
VPGVGACAEGLLELFEGFLRCSRVLLLAAWAGGRALQASLSYRAAGPCRAKYTGRLKQALLALPLLVLFCKHKKSVFL